jgi:hypothetical protein
MALIIPVGYAQAVYELQLTGDNELMVTTMGHDLTGVTGGAYEDAANDLHGAWATEMMGLVSNQYTFIGVTLYVGQDGGPPAIYESTAPSQAGGDTAATLPQNCAYLLRKRTSAAGRRGRGRMYIPGVSEPEVDALGVIDGTWLTTIQASADGWLAQLGVGGVTGPLPPVILHREEGIGVEPPPTPVTVLEFAERIATQRQRLRP